MNGLCLSLSRLVFSRDQPKIRKKRAITIDLLWYVWGRWQDWELFECLRPAADLLATLMTYGIRALERENCLESESKSKNRVWISHALTNGSGFRSKKSVFIFWWKDLSLARVYIVDYSRAWWFPWGILQSSYFLLLQLPLSIPILQK